MLPQVSHGVATCNCEFAAISPCISETAHDGTKVTVECLAIKDIANIHKQTVLSELFQSAIVS